MEIFNNFFSLDIPGEVISSFIVMGIIAILAIIIGIHASVHDPLKKSWGLLLIAEIGVEFFDNFVEGMIGKRLKGFGGIIMGLGVYLFISFIFGLTGLPSPVTYMAVPLSLGLVAFLMIHIVSMQFTKFKYFKRYVEPFFFFLPVNLISMWAPLLSLTLRLFGNAIAGWTLMTIVEFFCSSLGTLLISAVEDTVFAGFLIPIVTPLLHAYFDLFSGLIQTVVFMSLVTIQVGSEVPEEDEQIILNKREGGQ